jgi:hypothetical protein
MNPAVKSWMSANINRGKQGPSFMDPAVVAAHSSTLPAQPDRGMSGGLFLVRDHCDALLDLH